MKKTIPNPPVAPLSLLPPALPRPGWTFLSNHGHVLICLARQPDAKLREVAQIVGITERAVQKILLDLEAAGVVDRSRVGRRNHYRIHGELPLRHPLEAHRSIEALLRMVLLDNEWERIQR